MKESIVAIFSKLASFMRRQYSAKCSIKSCIRRWFYIIEWQGRLIFSLFPASECAPPKMITPFVESPNSRPQARNHKEFMPLAEIA